MVNAPSPVTAFDNFASEDLIYDAQSVNDSAERTDHRVEGSELRRVRDSVAESFLKPILDGDTSGAPQDVSSSCVTLLDAITSGRVAVDVVLGLRSTDAQKILDALQAWLNSAPPSHRHQRNAFYLLVKIASASNQVPPSLFVRGVDIGALRDPVATGGFSDIYRGTYSGQKVAVKKLRMLDSSKEKMHLMFCKEALIWRQLEHPNVVPFLGIDNETFATTGFLCMVSLWMNHGTIMEFLRSTNYEAMRDGNRLLEEVARGLHYLHSQKVIHGDINGANIFIDEFFKARIADFGLTNVGDITAGRLTTTDGANGTWHWMAPELVIATTPMRRRSESDVYAYGCLCLAVYTWKSPFPHLTGVQVAWAVSHGHRPPRPTSGDYHGIELTDHLWELVTRCWDQDPTRRPKMVDIVAFFEAPKKQKLMRLLEAIEETPQALPETSSDLATLSSPNLVNPGEQPESSAFQTLKEVTNISRESTKRASLLSSEELSSVASKKAKHDSSGSQHSPNPSSAKQEPVSPLDSLVSHATGPPSIIDSDQQNDQVAPLPPKPKTHVWKQVSTHASRAVSQFRQAWFQRSSSRSPSDRDIARFEWYSTRTVGAQNIERDEAVFWTRGVRGSLDAYQQSLSLTKGHCAEALRPLASTMWVNSSVAGSYSGIPMAPLSAGSRAAISPAHASVLFRATVAHIDHPKIDARLQINQIVDVIQVNLELWLVRIGFDEYALVPPACISLQHTFEAFYKISGRAVKPYLPNSIDQTCRMEFEVGQLFEIAPCSGQWFLARKVGSPHNTSRSNPIKLVSPDYIEILSDNNDEKSAQPCHWSTNADKHKSYITLFQATIFSSYINEDGLDLTGHVVEVLNVETVPWRVRIRDGTTCRISPSCLSLAEQFDSMPITAARVLKSYSAIRRSSVEPFRMSVTEGETLDVLFSPVGNWLLARKVAPTNNACSTSKRVGLVQAYQLALL